MKFKPFSISGIHQQRGFWLRCFLEQALVAAFLVLVTVVAASAQLSRPSPYHLARLRGIYADQKGNPLAGAAVTLDRDDKTFYSTTTNAAGKFEIKHVSGRYILRINRAGNSPVGRDVIVGVEAATYLMSSTLYILAGPAACSDDCSAVFTSKDKFDKEIQKRNTH
jgi:hypothetical protein